MKGKRQKRSNLEFLEDKLVRLFSRRVKPGSESSPMYIILLDPVPLSARTQPTVSVDRNRLQQRFTPFSESVLRAPVSVTVSLKIYKGRGISGDYWSLHTSGFAGRELVGVVDILSRHKATDMSGVHLCAQPQSYPA